MSQGQSESAEGRQHPRRVVMLIENLPVPLDRRVWQEAQTLRDAGHEVTVICPRAGAHRAAFEELEGIRIHRYWLPVDASGALGFALEYGVALLSLFRLTLWVALRRGVDVIHAANPPDLLFLVALPFRPFGVRYVFDHHDLCPELYVEKFARRDLGYKIMRWAERMSFRLADVVISNNRSYREVALTRGQVSEDRVFVVHSYPNLSRLKRVEPDPEIRARARYIAGYVGIMGDQDGLDDLMRIIAAFRERRPRNDTHFLLIGDGPARAAAEALAEELGIGDLVTFTGILRGEALNRALSSIDVGLCPDPPSDYTTRCTMNKVVEYMAMGRPLVQFNLIEGRRSAEDAALYAEDGDVADFAAKIIRLLDEDGLREEMGRAARQRVETALDWHREAAALRAAYARLFPARAQSPAAPVRASDGPPARS